VTILPLTAPVNPYRKDYEPWDEWIYAHAVTCTDPTVEKYFRGVGGRNNMVLDAYVDSSGFLVPQRLAEQRRLHAQATGRDDQPVYMPSWTHVLYAAGPIDDGLLAGLNEALLALRAEYVVTVPQWLAADPPAWSLILPPEAGAHAGEVVMYGKPGLDQNFFLPPGEIRPSSSRAVYYRYSTTGKLLGQTKVSQEWWELYTANPASPQGPGSSSFYKVFEALGVVSVTDVRTGKRAWLMDFAGTHLPDVRNPAPRDANHWLGLSASEVKTIYAIQHAVPGSAKPATKARPKGKPAPRLGGAAKH
jgi:hypothetical protein